MKKFYFAIALIIPGITLHAQRHATEITLSPHDTVNYKVADTTQYAFNAYTNGVVIYKDGNAGGRLNYNYLTEEMLFINPQNNKVQALANMENVLLVYIDKRRFIPTGNQNQFAELITFSGDTGLAVSRKVKIITIGKQGAYGVISPTSSINTYDSQIGGNESTVKLNTSQTARVDMENHYYWWSEGKLKPVKNVKSFTKIFGEEKGDKIGEYIREEHLDIHKENDMLRIADYCLSL